jgi:hypothetical protein
LHTEAGPPLLDQLPGGGLALVDYTHVLLMDAHETWRVTYKVPYSTEDDSEPIWLRGAFLFIGKTESDEFKGKSVDDVRVNVFDVLTGKRVREFRWKKTWFETPA